MHFETTADNGAEAPAGVAPAIAESIFSANSPAAGQAKPKRIELVPFHVVADTALSASTKPLVKGSLDRGTLSVVYGPSNVGKTFAAMSVAFHVAAGLPWAT